MTIPTFANDTAFASYTLKCNRDGLLIDVMPAGMSPWSLAEGERGKVNQGGGNGVT